MNVCAGFFVAIGICYVTAVALTWWQHRRAMQREREVRESNEYVLPLVAVQPDEIGTNGKGEEIRLVRQ